MLKKVLKYILPVFIRKNLRKYFYAFLLGSNNRMYANIFGLSHQKIIFLDNLQPVKVIEEALISNVVSPSINDNKKYYIDVVAPAVGLYTLDNIVVNATSSNFITQNNMIIERIPSIDLEYCDYSTGAIVLHDSKKAICRTVKLNLQEINDGIFLGGNGSWNYYHWMTEILPKIEFLKKNDIFGLSNNLLVSDVVGITESFKKTLEEALKENTVNVIYLNPLEYYKVNKLYVVSTPNNVLFNSKKVITSVKYNFYRKKSLNYVREIVLNMMYRYNQTKLAFEVNNLKNEQGHVHIFLARKKESARKYNQDEMFDLLSREFNVKAVYIEDYTIEEQAFIFSMADLIIGPSGAAWTNLIFSKEGTVAISWIPTHLKDFSVYSTIASYYGVQKYFIDCMPKNNKELHSDYEVSLDRIRIQLQHLGF
jgi:capsular polysaccharide biosynthesis protein